MSIFEFPALSYLEGKTKIVTQPVDGDSCPANFHSHVTHERMVHYNENPQTFQFWLLILRMINNLAVIPQNDKK